MDQVQPQQVNRTIDELNAQLNSLADKIRSAFDQKTLKAKIVSAIIPGREAEGTVQVPISVVQYQAQQAVNQYRNGIDPSAQQKINNLYNGLVECNRVATTGGRRRKTKRRRGSKRRGTKRRRSSRR